MSPRAKDRKVTPASQLASYVGRHGVLVTASEKLTVAVRIEDARTVFGRVDLYVVTDQVSEGAWVECSRVIFPQERA